AHERADTRRIRSAAYSDKIHFSPELGLNDGERDDAGMVRGIFRHERKAKPRSDHSQGPIVALAPIRGRASHAFLLKDMIGVAGKLAIHSMDIAFPVQLPDREGALASEPMPAMDGDDHLLRKQRHDMGAVVEWLDILGQTLCLNSSLVHGFQMRAHHLAQLGEMRQVPLAVKKWATKLAFELLYRTRERRLRHAALFRRAREVQFLCHPEEISNLMHFHDNLTG